MLRSIKEERNSAALSCIPLDCNPVVFDVIQFAVKLLAEDAFVSAFAYIDLRLGFLVKKV